MQTWRLSLDCSSTLPAGVRNPWPDLERRKGFIEITAVANMNELAAIAQDLLTEIRHVWALTNAKLIRILDTSIKKVASIEIYALLAL